MQGSVGHIIWTVCYPSVLTGLSRIDVPQGAALLGGDAIGSASDKVRLRLLHHGRGVDAAAMAARFTR